MTREISPGLVLLHGNRLELLTEAVFDWLGRTPLAPLEEEIFLVQSNGAAEWLKMNLARRTGVCAATRVELPARFLWRAYRQMLGGAAVSIRSALDKEVLTWSLMRGLPRWALLPGFEPVAGFLRDRNAHSNADPSADPGADRRLQLASRLADLFDQYQVYRADWLQAWAAGQDLLIGATGQAQPLPADQRWQAQLWRQLLGELTPAQRQAIRPQVHADFLAALASGQAPVGPLPRRVVLFGASHLSGQALAALAALSGHSQVLLAVPNPCRFHWADILDGRELQRAAPPRQHLRGGLNLAQVPLAAMHHHAHPLLAAWGRQGRDFMRLLDQFDADGLAAKQPGPQMELPLELPRIDLFDDGPGDTMLAQLQADIRDLVPLAELPARHADPLDRSLVFHTAHSAQREVEILHDQLLQLLAQPCAPGNAPGHSALAPRDVVVMVPDIERFAPAIRAVFGQVGPDDARWIPFDIADLPSRGGNPMLVALEWLLHADTQRFAATELRDLLDVPAIARRFGVDADSLGGLARWIAGAGVRWGLHAAQRATLGLGAAGEQNTWLFGLRRMLLGYATGGVGDDPAAFDGITPYDEIGGLEAHSVGALAHLLDRLDAWWRLCRSAAPPSTWVQQARDLLAAWFAPTDEMERLTLLALQAALAGWAETCESAGFDEPVPLSVLREAWLAALDSPAGAGRFLAGGVTFCTLMPLRAIPFEVVCLLGMNEGDYPRAGQRNDFDLMGQPGQPRPGDRSRRDDDRYLMLEALLSARRALYISWTGRSARDNSVLPPSVLVAQLRDHLVAGWPGVGPGQPADAVLRQRTTEHPLQPFGRRYFEVAAPAAAAAPPALFTYAREWRAAHGAQSLSGPAAPPSDTLPLFESTGVALTVDGLARFLRNPVKEFFRLRLDVVFAADDEALEDDEAFALPGLDQHQLLRQLLDRPDTALPTALAQIRGAGQLPISALGQRAADELADAAAPLLAQWRQWQQSHSVVLPALPLRFDHQGLRLDDWLTGQRCAAGSAGAPSWAQTSASRLLLTKPVNGKPALAAAKLLQAWVRMLAASACGHAARGLLIARDATLLLQPLPTAEAGRHLATLMAAWQQGMQAPLPLAIETGLAWLVKPDSAELTYQGGYAKRAEADDPCLARVYPDFAALRADGRFAALAQALLAPLLAWSSHHVQIIQVAADASAGNAEAGDG